jgi:hypothetical protein
MTKPEKIGIALIVVAASILTMPEALGDDFLSRKESSLEVSESVLCGIDISRDTVEEAINRFGAPSKVTFTPMSKTTSAVTTYEWETKSSLLQILVGGLRPSILRIDVWGARSEGTRGMSGHGLKLGDTVENAKRIYHLRSPFATTFPTSDIFRLAYAEAFGPTVEINFDSDGKVNHMKLMRTTDQSSY